MNAIPDWTVFNFTLPDFKARYTTFDCHSPNVRYSTYDCQTSKVSYTTFNYQMFNVRYNTFLELFIEYLRNHNFIS
jgi:hypothetical protein